MMIFPNGFQKACATSPAIEIGIIHTIYGYRRRINVPHGWIGLGHMR